MDFVQYVIGGLIILAVCTSGYQNHGFVLMSWVLNGSNTCGGVPSRSVVCECRRFGVYFLKP